MAHTNYDIVKQKLETLPSFRERKSRHTGLVALALGNCGIRRKYEEGTPLTVKEMSDFAVAYDSFRHAWTDCTKDYPELRGSDWSDKKALEQSKKLELGYQPGHYQVKQQVLSK